MKLFVPHQKFAVVLALKPCTLDCGTQFVSCKRAIQFELYRNLIRQSYRRAYKCFQVTHHVTWSMCLTGLYRLQMSLLTLNRLKFRCTFCFLTIHSLFYRAGNLEPPLCTNCLLTVHNPHTFQLTAQSQ